MSAVHAEIKLRPSRKLLTEQAALVGVLIDLPEEKYLFSAAEKELLEGIWNFLQAVLDVAVGEVVPLEVQEGDER